jgi:tetratricopeptide (TPR) repeat protein
LIAALILAAAFQALSAAARAEDAAVAARRLLVEGRIDRALEAVEAALARSPGDRDLRELQAICLYELGDFSGSERSLTRLLDDAPRELPAPLRAALLVRLAEVRSLQGDETEALAAAGEALRLDAGEEVLRAAASLQVRAHRYAEALPHLYRLLALRPGDPSLHFLRGVARARLGLFEEAVGDLERAAASAGGGPESRYELALALSKLGRHREALVELRRLVEEEPTHAEASYLAARQLLALKHRPALQQAAHLQQYFETLRAGEGHSSREEHLAAAGRPLEALIERLRRRERLADLEKLIAELAEARRRRGETAALELFAAGFWLRHGLLAEAETALEKARRARAAVRDIEAVEEAIAAARRGLLALEGTPLSRARRRLAESRWPLDAATALEEILPLAQDANEPLLADQAARLLLAAATCPAAALEHLAARAAHPALLPVRLHYLRRRAACEPERPRWKKELEAARALFEGR